MKNPIKQMGLMLTAAVVMAAGMNCAGASKQQPSVENSVKSTAADELDVAIRNASDYLNKNVPKGSKIVILNVQSNSTDLSDYIIDELIANAVNDKVFTVVDRQQLDAIRAEQNFQMSGAVDDKEALAIGKFFGANTVVSGAVNRLGTGYRIRIRALEVQTAQVQGQYNRNITSSQTINFLMEGGSSASGSYTTGTTSSARNYSTTDSYTTVPAPIPAPARAAAPTPAPAPIPAPAPARARTRSEIEAKIHSLEAARGAAPPPAPAPAPASAYTAPTASATIATPTTPVTVVPGNSLSDKLAWLTRSADSHNTYILELNADDRIAPHTTFKYPGAINVTIVLRGVGGNRTVRLSSNGTMFIITDKITFILENDITLMGHKGNSGSMVYVDGGTFKMNAGAVITGNDGSGEYYGNAGTGVYMNNGTFEMSGGDITGNTAKTGGGVNVSGTFIMTGGTISNNTAQRGGGVSISRGTFTMRGGAITGNTASENGGGVCFLVHGYTVELNKTGGTITGYKSDPSNGNAVKDVDGNDVARKGHAIWKDLNTRKETTAGPNVNLSYGGSKGKTGAWDE